VVLTDLGLPGMRGTEVVARLRELMPGTPVLVLTVFGADQYVFDALCAGACGYLLKDVEPARLLAAIREVHTGGAPMSPEIARRVVGMFQRLAGPKTEESVLSARELEVLQLLAEGDSYKTCADRLKVSIDTIRFHVRHIYERLHVHTRSEAVSKGLRSGWIR
jgi:DNA-binding NarL/FixJ family response regulator